MTRVTILEILDWFFYEKNLRDGTGKSDILKDRMCVSVRMVTSVGVASDVWDTIRTMRGSNLRRPEKLLMEINCFKLSELPLVDCLE